MYKYKAICILSIVILLSCYNSNQYFVQHDKLAQMYIASDSLTKAIEEWQLALKAHPENRLASQVTDNILIAKNKLKQQEMLIDSCRLNMIKIGSASLIGYAENSLAGNAHYSDIDELISRKFLEGYQKCPSGGEYIFNTETGMIKCSIHGVLYE